MPIIQESVSKLARQAANEQHACPPCTGDCRQGRDCTADPLRAMSDSIIANGQPAMRKMLEREDERGSMEMLVAVLAVVVVIAAIAICWHYAGDVWEFAMRAIERALAV